MSPEARTALTAIFAVLATLLVLTHRWWPEECKKVDLAFAGDADDGGDSSAVTAQLSGCDVFLY